MTPAEYAEWTDSILRYVGGLLTHPAGTPEWTIGRTFALMGDMQRLTYVEQLTGVEGTRAYEIGVDLRELVLRWSAVEPQPEELADAVLAATGSGQ